MSAPKYTPKPGSLASLLVGYFTNHPGAELSIDEISDTFDTVRNNIHSNLATAVQNKALVRARNDDGEYVYRCGKLPKTADLAIDADGARLQNKPRGIIQVQMPDIDNIQIDDGIPLPGRCGVTKADWRPLLAKLKPGQSVVLPINARHTLSNAMTDAKKAGDGTYSIRCYKESDTLRIWRIS